MWLRNCWQVAAFAHEVIGGQLFARRICDEPIVLFRAPDSRAVAARLAHRQRRKPMRAAVVQRVRQSLRVTPQHNRLIEQLSRQ